MLLDPQKKTRVEKFANYIRKKESSIGHGIPPSISSIPWDK
jgi:hypothetical protein